VSLVRCRCSRARTASDEGIGYGGVTVAVVGLGETDSMPVQDDERERQMLQLFNLVVPPERKRSDTDAYLRLGREELAFELKSTTSGSVSTVRDFGPDHILKWRGKHWLFGFYDREGRELQYCCYGSPAAMEPWIHRLEQYIRPDLVLAEAAARGITEADVVAILGDKAEYTVEDVRLIQKNQWSAEQYRTGHDLPESAWSRSRMVEVLRERCRYVIRRGATLNNPHIPAGHFAGWARITEDHAATLRQMVQSYLDSARA
jgi:hypothetical protein